MSAPRTEATQVRIARFEDLDALVRVTAPVSEDAEQRISALLRDPDGRVLVAVEHGEFLGWVFVRTDTFTTVLSDVTCADERVTSALVAAAVRLAREWGCRSLSWRILATDLDSLAVAVAQGLVVTGVVAMGAEPRALLLTAQRFLADDLEPPKRRVELVRLPADLATGARDGLRPRLLALARDPSVCPLVLDGSEVTTMSPVALGVLVAVARIARERGGQVHIDRPSRRLARGLMLAGLRAGDLTRIGS